jgi:8-oxo-dGTP pyrophosphatase MutT (NUDIX family)
MKAVKRTVTRETAVSRLRRALTKRIKPRLYAGGIVVRIEDGEARILIVTTRNSRRRWVLPKGRVEKGESAGAAALREVREESGVSGRLLDYVADARYWSTKGRIHIEYYLIEYRRAKRKNGEDREVAWCSVKEAMRRLTYASARRVLLVAHKAIRDYARASRRSS